MAILCDAALAAFSLAGSSIHAFPATAIPFPHVRDRPGRIPSAKQHERFDGRDCFSFHQSCSSGPSLTHLGFARRLRRTRFRGMRAPVCWPVGSECCAGTARTSPRCYLEGGEYSLCHGVNVNAVQRSQATSLAWQAGKQAAWRIAGTARSSPARRV